MTCCHTDFVPTEGHEHVFAVDPASIVFGTGALSEVGARARELGMTRVAVFTDSTLAQLPYPSRALESLQQAGVDAVLYDTVAVEPTDGSFLAAVEFATDGRFDGYVSVGGGSVIDTAKAANLFATHPADLLDYVNAPIGAARPVPAPLRPHIACPTTSGTGSECTGIAIFDYLALRVKTGISSRFLKPTVALVDPDVTASLPSEVVAASGFDVLAHALESYTARPFTMRESVSSPSARPLSQGANPWSDLGCEAALTLLGAHLERAVLDSHDHEARHQMMWAATLAGIAFGNSGVHIPHAMSYSVAGLVRDFHPAGYPHHEPMVPHGMSVILNAPAAFRATAASNPRRHRRAAELLGVDVSTTSDAEIGHALAEHLQGMMHRTGIPNGVAGVGYTTADIPDLVAGAFAQQRLLVNAPIAVDEALLADLYAAAMRYW